MIKIQALFDLVKRYVLIFTSVWSVRHTLDSPHRLSHELVFLPASLELADTPVHPLPRWTMRLTCLFAILGLLIAILGRLDIVIVAKGKLVPNARVKVIQPAITGVVKKIYVEDGQRVAVGALLIELDATQAASDALNAHQEKVSNILAKARAQAILKAIEVRSTPSVEKVNEASKEESDQTQQLAEASYHEYLDKLAQAQAALVQRKAELNTTYHDIEGLKETAPLARKQANDYKSLVADKYVSQVDYLEKEQIAVQQEHDLATKTSHSDELMAAITAQQAQIASITSQFRREQLDVLNQANQKLEEAHNAEIKAMTRQQLLSLYSPVAGTIQQLATHTLGGVVTTAQPLMEIVPDDALEVEAKIENKDVGFVRKNQETIVKIEAFPYTRYGYLHGVVDFISNDAVENRKDGLTFVAHIHLNTSKIFIGDHWFELTPGMAVSAEIKTGKRTVAGYFLNPLLQTVQESMRER